MLSLFKGDRTNDYFNVTITSTEKDHQANIIVSRLSVRSSPEIWTILVVPPGCAFRTTEVSRISQAALNAAPVEGIRWWLEERAMPACCHGQRVRCAVQASPAGRLGRRQDVHAAEVHRERVRRLAHLHHR